jgi:hypothetical protein
MTEHHAKPSEPFVFNGKPERLTHLRGVEPTAEALLIKSGNARLLVNPDGEPFADKNGHHLMVSRDGHDMAGARVLKLNGKETVILEIASQPLPTERAAEFASAVRAAFEKPMRETRGR